MNTSIMTPKKICSRLGLACLLMMAAWLGLLFAAEFIVIFAAPSLLGNTWAVWLLNDIPLYLAGLPIFLLVIHFIPNAPPALNRPEVRFGAGKFLILLVFCFGASYALNFAGGALMELLHRLIHFGGGNEGGYLNPLEALPLGDNLPAALIFGVLLPAFGEEFIFRYLIRRKLGGAGDRTYILFSALCFALFHMNLIQGMYAFVIGIALAWAYTVSNRLWISILLHFIFNFFGIVVASLAVWHEWLAIAWGVLVVLLIPAGIVLFFVFKNYAFAAMRPPMLAGWPYKPSRPKVQKRQARVFGPAYYALFGRFNHPQACYGCPLPGYIGQGCGYSAPQPQPYPPYPAPRPPVPSAAPPPQPQPLQPYPLYPPWASAAPPRYNTAPGVCLANPGMICYMSISGALMFITALVSLFF